MTVGELRKKLRRLGCTEIRQEGSHVTIRCGAGCQTEVAVHSGDIPTGTLRAIERQLAPCLGKGWMGRR